MKKFLCIILASFLIISQATPVFAEYYDFSDEAQEKFDRQEALKNSRNNKQQGVIEIRANPQLEKVKRKEQKFQTYEQKDIYELDKRTMTGSVMTVPKGESFDAILQSSISSDSLAENDTIAATLCTDWYYDGILIAPQGSVLYGHATDIKKAGYAYSNGKLAMTFDEILTPAGDRIKLSSNKVYIDIKESKRGLKIAGNVVIGAVGGLVTGVLYSLISRGDVAGGLAIGSAIGAAGGVVSAVAHKGEAVEVPAGTVITVRLVQPVEVVPYN